MMRAARPMTAEEVTIHSPVKSDLTIRLNRIEGQVRGVKGLIDKDTYCDQVLNQIAAIQAALNSLRKVLLSGHIKECVVDRIRSCR